MYEKHHLLGADFFSPFSLPLRVLTRYPQPPYPIHTHDFSELVIVVSGHGEHVTGNSIISVERGDVFIINGDQKHGYQNLQDLHLINLLFDIDKMGIPLFDLWESPAFQTLFRVAPGLRGEKQKVKHLHIAEDELKELLTLVEKERQLEEESTKPSMFLRMVVFLEIVNFLIQIFETHDKTDHIVSYSLGEVFAYLEKNLDKNPSIQELCNIGNMSESSLLRAFKTLTSMSPKKYHTHRRMQKAADLLKHTQLSITEIADTLGFEDSNYFTRLFRKYLRMSPSEYKKNFS